MIDATMRDSENDGQWTMADYIDLIIRQRTLVILTFILVMAAAVFYTFARKPQYMSSATLSIEVSGSKLGTPTLQYVFSYDGQVERRRQIDYYRAFLSSFSFQEELLTAIDRDSLLRQREAEPEAIDAAIRNLRLQDSEETEMVVFQTKSTDPMIVYRVAANGLEIFQRRAREFSLEETSKMVDYIEKQKEIAGTKLEETERFLQELTNNAQSAGFSSDESGILRKLLQLEFQLAEIRGQRELAEANIAAYDSRLRELKVPEQPGLASMNSPEVVQLQRELELLVNQRERLSSSGASRQQLVEIEQKIAEKRDALFKKIIQTQDMPSGNIAMEQNLADQIRQNRVKEELELYMLRNRERYFSQLLQRYRNENPRIVDRAIEEAQLKRSKMVYENLYSILLEKGEEARIRAATSLGGIRIIDAPHLPESPIPVNYVRNILLGLILALGLGVGLAMGREYFDNTIRNKEELARRTGLSVIGVVPEMHSHKTSDDRDLPKKENQPRSTTAGEFDRSSNGYAGHLISQMKPRDPVVDAYRTLRTNLQFASTDQPISALMVTSALPGEGKTLSAANVAISFAELGQRVLLIDGDMRKPMQHTIFGVNSIPGLSDSMIKGYGVSQVVRQTGVPNLRLVPCGTIPPNPAEMIASRRMADFIGQCRQMFDLVVVDTPPVRLVTDPLLFAAKTTHTLLVVRANSTQIRDVQEAMSLLRRTKIPLLGALFNQVKTARGYGDYHRYDYYYHAEPAEKEKKRK